MSGNLAARARQLPPQRPLRTIVAARGRCVSRRHISRPAAASSTDEVLLAADPRQRLDGGAAAAGTHPGVDVVAAAAAAAAAAALVPPPEPLPPPATSTTAVPPLPQTQPTTVLELIQETRSFKVRRGCWGRRAVHRYV